MRRHWIVVAAGGAAVFVLLVLAAVGSRQEGWRGGGRGATLREVPASVIDAAYTLLVLAVIAGVVAAAVALRRFRPEFRAMRERFGWQSVVLVVGCALAAAYILTTTEVGRRLTELFENRGEPGEEGGGAGLPADPTGAGHDPTFQWWLAVPVTAAAIAVYVWYRRRGRPERRERRELADELEAVLTDTLDDLELDADPRRAVIHAYARMERVLGAHGLPRRPAEAPLEYLARVLAELNVRADAAHALTELFERAKFSQHEIDVAMKEEAIAALATVRDDLKDAA